MSKDKNTQIEDENIEKIKEYKNHFYLTVTLYTASMVISFLTASLGVMYDSFMKLAHKIYDIAPGPRITNVTLICIGTIIMSLATLRKAGALRNQIKAPELKYAITLIVLTIIGWFLCVYSWIAIPLTMDLQPK